MGDTRAVYSSLDRVDGSIQSEGGAVMAQVLSDHRGWTEIEAEPEISILFALIRIRSARAHARRNRFAQQINYIVTGPVPPFFRNALASADVVLTNITDAQRVPLSRTTARPSELVDAAFEALARRVQRRTGSSDLAMVLHGLEAETVANPPDKAQNEIEYWTRVVELAAIFGEVMRARNGGSWIEVDGQTIPFGFKGDDDLVTFPANRAQRLIGGETDASLFDLLRLEAVRAEAATHVTILPSLRSRDEAMQKGLKFRPLLPYTPATHAAPVVAYGWESNDTFALLTTSDPRTVERLDGKAIEALAVHAVTVEEVTGSMLAITGSYFAAEKLLDRGFMRSLHERTGCVSLAVAVPRRGLMLVAPAASDLVEITKAELAKDEPISPIVLVVRDGVVCAPQAVELRAPAPMPAAAPVPSGLFRRLFRRS